MAKKQHILPKMWQLNRPYTQLTNVDVTYLRWANELLDLLIKDGTLSRWPAFTEERLLFLSCFMIGYMEDKASDLGLWDTFTRLHQEKYEKPLPMVEFSEEYDPELLNREDVLVLLWYFATCMEDEMILVFPENEAYSDVGTLIFNFLEDRWEKAPHNQSLVDAFKISEPPENIEGCDIAILKITNQSWLFSPDLLFQWQGVQIELNDQMQEEDPEEAREAYFRTLLFWLKKIHTRLFAITPWEWASAFYGPNHPEAKRWFDMKGLVISSFRYISSDETHIQIQHIPTAHFLKIGNGGFSLMKDYLEGDPMILGLCLYQGEWLLVDVVNAEPRPAELESVFEEIEDLLEFENLVPALRKKAEAEADLNHKDLKTVLPDKDLIFVEEDQLEAFFTSMLPEPLRQNPSEKARNIISIINEGKHKKKSQEVFAIFINPVSGLELIEASVSCLADPANPTFNKKTAEIELLNLLIQSDTSTELCRFLLHNYGPRLEFWNSGPFATFSENADFVFRLAKGSAYFSRFRRPQVLREYQDYLEP